MVRKNIKLFVYKLNFAQDSYFMYVYISILQSALNRHTVRLFTENDDTRRCNNTICSPEDEQGTARNMLRVIM